MAARARHAASDKAKETRALYEKTDAYKEAMAKYGASPKGKATIARYQATDKGKAAARRAETSEKGRASAARTRKSEKRRLSHIFRRTIWHVLKSYGTRKSMATFDLIGCSVIELQLWLLFLANWTAPGATYVNYPQWEIDHIIACGRWDLKCPLQQYLCFHWTNLQPLWADDHKQKSKNDFASITKRELNHVV